MLYNIPTLPAVDHEDGEMYGSPIPDECKIPSELIEPYLQRFLMMCLEEIAYFNTPIGEIKARLDGVRCYGGIHANLATNNVYHKFIDIPEDKLKEMAKDLAKKQQET